MGWQNPINCLVNGFSWGLCHPYKWSYNSLLITGFWGPPRNKHSPGLRTPIWTTGAKARVRGEGGLCLSGQEGDKKSHLFFTASGFHQPCSSHDCLFKFKVIVLYGFYHSKAPFFTSISRRFVLFFSKHQASANLRTWWWNVSLDVFVCHSFKRPLNMA